MISPPDKKPICHFTVPTTPGHHEIPCACGGRAVIDVTESRGLTQISYQWHINPQTERTWKDRKMTLRRPPQ